MRKQIALVLLAAAGIAGLYLIARNQHVAKNDAYFEGVSQYVYAFTSGAIGRDDAIRVRTESTTRGNSPLSTALIR